MRSSVVLLLAVLGSSHVRPVGADDTPLAPILFVHGNGDTAALWHTTIWRFESNGYDRDRLFAVDMPHPSARSLDNVPEPNRSSTTDQRRALAREVDRVLEATGSTKLVLVGSSRGGNAIRDYIRNGGGHLKVSMAILCGTPNHGVVRAPTNLDAEFNGAGHFLSGLNEGSEVHPDVSFVTIRSERNDKYAQPTGEILGMGDQPTGVGYDGPELGGAENIVLPELDHREVAFHPDAFRAMYRAIVGRPPERIDIVAEDAPVLDGLVTGYENGAPTNLPVSGADVAIYEVDPETGSRRGAPAHSVTTGRRRTLGPLLRRRPRPSTRFVVREKGGTSRSLHYYRSPFPRSSRVIHLRLAPLSAFGMEDCGGSGVFMTRPRGYFGLGRDEFSLDGQVPDGVREGVPSDSTASRCFPARSSAPLRRRSRTSGSWCAPTPRPRVTCPSRSFTAEARRLLSSAFLGSGFVGVLVATKPLEDARLLRATASRYPRPVRRLRRVRSRATSWSGLSSSTCSYTFFARVASPPSS